MTVWLVGMAVASTRVYKLLFFSYGTFLSEIEFQCALSGRVVASSKVFGTTSVPSPT